MLTVYITIFSLKHVILFIDKDDNLSTNRLIHNKISLIAAQWGCLLGVRVRPNGGIL